MTSGVQIPGIPIFYLQEDQMKDYMIKQWLDPTNTDEYEITIYHNVTHLIRAIDALNQQGGKYSIYETECIIDNS